jgi:hypothetical protein
MDRSCARIVSFTLPRVSLLLELAFEEEEEEEEGYDEVEECLGGN